MRRQRIASSSIRTAGYEDGVLEIEFTSGSVYRYVDVPPEVWRAFLATSTKGGYFIARIRDRFKCECVYRPPRKEKTNGSDQEKKVSPAGSPEARTEKKKARIS